MKHQTVLILSIFVLLFFSTGTFSQQPEMKDGTRPTAPELFTVGEVRGVVNAKAIYLAKPVFPIEAREAGAEGTVRVEITIDEDGNVISANAVSGHPSLKISSEEAARKTKFRITRNVDGQAIKATGVLVYKFTIERASWSKIGYDLALLEKTPTLKYFSFATIAKAFQPEWTNELELLEKIAQMKRAEVERQANASEDNQPVFRRSIVKKPDGSVSSSMTGEIRLPIPNPPTPEQISVSQILIFSLQSRLGNDELSLWQFNLGVNLSKALELYRNPNERSNAAQILRQFSQSAPQDASAEVLAELQKLIVIFEKGKPTMNTHNEIGRSLSAIFRSK
ncbi:MAG: energy transducer TonB [Acidobacteria bacterium]|nr:energy transducer TonB [Acidobacteriota bacterium]MCA1636837.1 energy transducer TonB [Acidobacteriota bacterium]